MAVWRIFVLSALVITASAVDPGEVRIRSGPWSPPSTRISVDSRLVESAVTVRDHSGKLIQGLEQADFEVTDAGKVAPITFFSARSPAGEKADAKKPGSSPPESSAAPRSIAMFFDDEHADPFGINRAKIAAEKLIRSGIQQADRVAIFTSSGAISQEFTSDPNVLLAALGRLRSHRRLETMGVCPTLTPYQVYGIQRQADLAAKSVAVREAIACNCSGDDPDCPRRQVGVVESAAQIAWNQIEVDSAAAIDALGASLRQVSAAPGARVLLMMSQGFLTAGMEQRYDALVTAALRARVVVNALDASGLISVSPETLNNRDGARYEWAQRSLNARQHTITSLMAELAPATGGQFVQNSNDFDTAIDRLATIPAASYILGISPKAALDGEYHTLKVRLKKPGYRIDSRAGYYATHPARKAESAQEAIDRIVMSKGIQADFPATVQASSTLRGDNQLAVTVNTSVDAKALKFLDEASRHKQQLTFVTVLEDASGGFVAGKEAVMDMELTDTTLADLRAHGIRTSTSFAAPKGAYMIRSVVREGSVGKISAARTPVSQP